MKKSIIRNIIIIAAILILCAVGYEVFFSGKSSSASAGALQTTQNPDASADTSSDTGDGTNGSVVGQNFLTLLLSVQSIKLDDSIFTNPAFTLLQDFDRPIPPDTDPGRPDPFASLGVDDAAVSTQVSTSNPSSVTTTTSTLNGTLTIGDPTITRWFEYGTTTALGTTTPADAQATPGAFAETISGLTPNTTYYVKAAALIDGVLVGGNLVTWTTAQGGTQSQIPTSAKTGTH